MYNVYLLHSLGWGLYFDSVPNRHVPHHNQAQYNTLLGDVMKEIKSFS